MTVLGNIPADTDLDTYVIAAVGAIDPTAGVLPSSLAVLTALAEDDTFLVWDTSASELKQISVANARTALARQGLPVTNTLGADATNNAAALADLTGMSWAVTSGRKYRLSIEGLFRSTATTAGLGVGFSIPAMTTERMWAHIRQAANGTDAYYEGDGPMATAIVSASVVATGTDYYFRVTAQFTPSADGTVQFRFQTEVGGQTATIRAGTSGTLIDVTGTP